MKNLIIITVLMFLIASCGKIKQTTTMSGQVVDYGTSEPIENVQIYVRDGFTGSGPILDNDDVGDSEALTYTDENGQFDVSIKAENNPVLYPSKSSEYWNYNEGGLVQSGEIYTKGEDYQDIKITLRALGKVGGFIVRQDNVKDSICVKGFLDFPDLYSFNRCEITNNFDIRERLAIGNNYFHLSIKYRLDGKWIAVEDSIYIEKGITNVDTIFL